MKQSTQTLFRLTRSLHTVAALLIVILVPALMHAQTLQWVNDMFDEIKTVLQTAVPVIIVFALVVFIWGVVVFMVKAGDEKGREEGKKKILWGLIGLFVIIAVWGLVRIIAEITGVQGANTINPPQSSF